MGWKPTRCHYGLHNRVSEFVLHRYQSFFNNEITGSQ
jgi:hypothetical protein